MSVYDAVLGAMVLEQGRAVRKTTVRHYHISDDAVLLSILRFGGERFRPVAFQFSELGKEIDVVDDLYTVAHYTDMAHLLTETQRFAARLRLVVESGRQIIVPNEATIKALGLAGRALAFRNRDRSYGLSNGQQDDLEVAGRYLLELGKYARTPGQALIVPLAERVADHWATLTAPFERSDLSTLHAQIYPQAVHKSGDNVFKAALYARSEPRSVGPNMHPEFEETEVYGIYDQVRQKVGRIDLDNSDRGLVARIKKVYATQTEWTHELMHTVLDAELRDLNTSPSAVERWKEDVAASERIVRRFGDPDTRYFARQLASIASQDLERMERAQARLQVRSMLDDPMLALDAVSTGKAITAHVLSHMEPEPLGRGLTELSIWVALDKPLDIDPEEVSLIWEWQSGQADWVVTEMDYDYNTIELTASARRGGPVPPPVGSDVIFIPSIGSEFNGRISVETPWTHKFESATPDEDVMHDQPVDDVPTSKTKAPSDQQGLDSLQEGQYSD